MEQETTPSEQSSELPPLVGDRYDHRDADQRAQDADEETMDWPMQDGASELRAATEAAVEADELGEHDPRPPTA